MEAGLKLASETNVLPGMVEAMRSVARLREQIRTAPTFEALNQVSAAAAALQKVYKPVKAVADEAGKCWIEAEVKLAVELAKIPRATGTRGQLVGPGVIGDLNVSAPTTAPTYEELGVERNRAQRASLLAAIPEEARDELIERLQEAGKAVTPEAVQRELRREKKETHRHEVSAASFSDEGPFGTVVIDPPWRMEKIDRDVAPNQDVFEYPTMSYEEIAALWKAEIESKVDPDCHLFLWTTQKHLPAAMKLVSDFGFRYVLTMVWHKPGGFQPFELPQYNCEFAIYGRKGSPVFVDTKDFNCCFCAPRREHSRKPDEFYDVIRRVTGGSRIDVFSREKREGFSQFGNQIDKFEGVA
jgi:N6-adenosine-specific RNA methylase IME4